MKFLKEHTKRIVAVILCMALICADILIPSSTAKAEDSSRTVGRYVDIESEETTKTTDYFESNGYQIAPGKNTAGVAERMYVMHVPEDMEGTATITDTAKSTSYIKMTKNYNRELYFRVIHYRAEEDVNEVLYPSDGGWHKYNYADKAYFMNDIGSIEVKAGDKVYLVVRSLESRGNLTTRLYLSFNIKYGDTTAAWKSTSSSNSTCAHTGVLAADATTTTDAFYGGTYTYGELLTYELGGVTDLVGDTTDMTATGVAEDFTVTGTTPTYGTDDGNYATVASDGWSALQYNTGLADYTASLKFKRPEGSTGSFGLYFDDNGQGVGKVLHFYNGATMLYDDARTTDWYAADAPVIVNHANDYADGKWHTVTVHTLGNRYFISIDGRLLYSTVSEAYASTYVDGLYTGTSNLGSGLLRLEGSDFSVKEFSWDSLDYVDDVAAAQFDAMYAICDKATEYGTDFETSGFIVEESFDQVATVVEGGLTKLRASMDEDSIATIKEETLRELEALKTTRPSVNVISPEDSSNFTGLTTKNGGALTTLDEETVYYSNGWYGFSYKEAVTDFSWDLEFMSSTTSSDLRIYFVQPSINSASGYVFRMYDGYLFLYTPGRSGWYTSSTYVFKSSKEYRDGNWHNLNVTLEGGQFFVSLDGVRFTPINNMKTNYTAASEYIYTNYTDVTAEDGTVSQVETDFDKGYLGIYGQKFYVRNFQIDFLNGVETVADAQFDALHDIFMQNTDICILNASKFTANQQAKAKEVGAIYREKVLSCITEEEIATVMTEYVKEMEKVTFTAWHGGLNVDATAFTVSGSEITTDANGVNSVVAGSDWTTVSYDTQIPENYRYELDFTFEESEGDARIYFYTNETKNDGYVLRFYNGSMTLYKAPFLETDEYWNTPATYAVFKSSAYDYQDGEKHQLTFDVCNNQFYFTIDGELIVVDTDCTYDSNYVDSIYTNTDNYGPMYITVAGTNYTVHDFVTTCCSRENAVAQAQFIRIFGIADYITNTLEKSTYGGDSWERVTYTADYYSDAIRDCYDNFVTTTVEELYAAAIVALAEISPTIEFDINEDFEDDSYEGNLKVVSGDSVIVDSEYNQYLDMTSTWNVVTTTQAAINYKANVDFKVADADAVYFNFNMWNTEGSRSNGYMLRLYPNGNSLNAQLYRGDGTESEYTWIWTYAGTDVYYRGSNWHNLKVLSYEGQMAIYLDNVLITPTSTSTAFTVENGVVTEDTYKWGYFGFQSQSAIAIDNLTVTAITSLTDEMAALDAYNDVFGSWYFNETEAVGEYWVNENATLNVYEDQMSNLTLNSGSIALTGNATVYTPHLALTYKATDYTDASVLTYKYAISGQDGYAVRITSSAVTLVRMDEGVETVLGTAQYQAFDTLNTIRVFQSAGSTYVYADATQLICVADTIYYQGAVSVEADNLTIEIYKLVLGSAVESAEIETVAVKEDLVITLNPTVEDDQVYLGYVLNGGDYTGALYNKAAGDEIAYFDGLTYKAVVIDLKMNYGASARAKTGSGLRWTTGIPTEQYEQLIDMGFTVGTRITSVGSDKYIDIPVEYGLWQDEETGMTYWNASLINIKEANYERIYNATAYVKGNYADDTEFQISGINDNNKRTYKGVTMAALADVKSSSTGEYVTQVEMVDGTSVYTYLTAAQYAFLKDVYGTIEALENDDDNTMYVNNNKTDNKTEIHFVNVSNAGFVGNALSAFIEYDNQVILFDGGTADEVSSARVIQCMKDEGIEKIDYLVISHEHHDHTGGLPAIIAAFDVDTVYVRPLDNYSDYMKKALDAAESKVNSDGTTVKMIIPRQEGLQVDLGEDTYFRIYNCTRIFDYQSTIDDGNYYSLQMHFVSGEGKAFFGGDAGGLKHNEEMLGKIGAVDIYQIQHHGHNALGNPYNPAALIDELQPKYSIASMSYSSSVADSLQAYLEKYGHVYKTGASGNSFTFKQGEDGHFCLKSEAEKGVYDNATTVTIEGETELAFNGGASRTDGQVYINGDRGMYLTSVYGKAAAHKINVPENMEGEVLARLIGTDIYRTATGEGNVYFRIIQNGTVVYETAFTGSQGGKDYKIDLSTTITLKAGDELYFATYCSEGATNTKLYCTMAMYLDGTYYDAGHSDHIDSADDTLLISKNHFNGTLYNNGSKYTCAEITTYVTFTVPDEWLFEVSEEAVDETLDETTEESTETEE